MEARPVITLLTDFGTQDIYVGVMKGVIAGVAPDARVIDLTHAVSPQDVLEGSARLADAVDYFPPGTIHLAVVDPGVGTRRAAVVAEAEGCLFVAPDNGLLTLPLRRKLPRRAAVIQSEGAARQYCLPRISGTFHGRDVFAPVAAHLARGLDLSALGPALAHETLRRLPVAEPEEARDPQGRAALRAHVLYADRFGNLVTDLTPGRWNEWARHASPPDSDAPGPAAPGLDAPGPDASGLDARALVAAGAETARGILRTFGDTAPGSLLAYWGSADRLEIAVRDGDAASLLGPKPDILLTLVP